MVVIGKMRVGRAASWRMIDDHDDEEEFEDEEDDKRNDETVTRRRTTLTGKKTGDVE